MRRVLLVNWDNYPNVASGGVYAWSKRLVEGIPDWDFVIINQVTGPSANASYAVPPNVAGVMEVPIFGTHRYDEFRRDKQQLLPKILRTSDRSVEKDFVPIFDEFLGSLMADDGDSRKVARLVLEMHRLLTIYDAKKCFEHPLTWEAFLGRISRDALYRGMSIKEALTVFQSLTRSMQVLGIEIPRVDVVHCSLAWIPSLVALVAKAESGCPIVVTEHGVAYRELMLYYNAYLFNEPSKIFWKVFARNVVRPVYEEADVIAPVCKANAGWETALGADPAKIKVIYNGIDTERFKPTPVRRDGNAPTVVSVARIDPFKDITTLAYAIKHARERIPNIRCLVFGDSNNLDYSLRCVRVVKEQNLGPSFTFMGGTKEPEKAYNLGDIVVFNGITEGFPFAVIEAMACGKAIVATAVGGVAEALEGCGILVKSRDPETLANGIVRLITDERLRNDLGQAALKRARSEFSLETSILRYKALYEELAEQRERTRHSVRTEEAIAR
jgi:polysaccharide biosynthesis protein PelF